MDANRGLSTKAPGMRLNQCAVRTSIRPLAPFKGHREALRQLCGCEEI
jgi:hypothetical protein